MHGTVFSELKKYVEEKLGPERWPDLLGEAGLGAKHFELLETYPDSDAVALVSAASRITGAPAADLLEDFGAFIAPHLIDMYWGLIEPEWKTLDLLEHTEEAIHKVVRLKNPGAQPPQLRVTRTGADRAVIEYTSERKMCPIAKGIVRGLAKHFAEVVEISEAECMHRGARRCLIAVRRA